MVPYIMTFSLLGSPWQPDSWINRKFVVLIKMMLGQDRGQQIIIQGTYYTSSLQL